MNVVVGSTQATPPKEERRRIRSGRHTGPTAGLAPGYVQGNVAILPQDYADEFLRFCQANPKPCPILAVSEVGDPALPSLGQDIDIRSDVPAYCIFRDGQRVNKVNDIHDLWRDDFVTFALGCSFSFEEALTAHGLEIRHVTQGCNVPMYRTDIDCVPAGRFQGKLVVSMRPFRPDQAIRAIQITSRFPAVHGAPVHLGRPELIGIRDITRPDFGDAVRIGDDEIPVYWACGVTPQVVFEHARPPIAITHAPGSMLITDLLNSQLAIL